MLPLAGCAQWLHNGYITTDTGPRSVAIDPSGKYLYLVSFYSFTIKAYAINAANGALMLVNSLLTGSNPISVTVDPSGKFVYVANINSDNISVYSINIGTGALTDIGIYAAGNEPASVTVNPTGQYLYVANQNSSGAGSVSIFSINTSTGVLTTVDADGVTAGNQATIAAGTWPQAIILDPSGSGTVSPLVSQNVVGGLAGTGSTQTLPIELQGGIAPAVLASGTLTVTDLNPGGSTTISTVYGGWAFANSGVTLGTNYSLTKTRPCTGPTQCTETWSLQPVSNSTPTSDTES